MKNTFIFLKKSCSFLFLFYLFSSSITAQSKSLVVLDFEFSQKTSVLNELPDNTAVLELNSGTNPWELIRKKLESNQDLKVIHLFANASYNSLRIGGVNYDIVKVAKEFELSMLEGLYQGIHLQLLVYNCNLASNEEGLNLLKVIGEKAYFNVGACTNCTSIFDSTFLFDFSTLNRTVDNSILQQ